MKAVLLQQVKKKLGQHDVLKNISFSVEEGNACALLGPNGAGKSTTLSLILGLRRPSSGVVQVFERSASESSVKVLRSTTPQELDFPQQLRVEEIFQFIGTQFSQVQEWSEALQFSHLFKRQAGGLSGGEKRKLGLLLALSLKPRLLILDEPTTGMDVESRNQLWSLLSQLKSKGITLLLCSHDLHEVEMLADQVVIVDRGEALFQGSVHEIRNRVRFVRVRVQCSGDVSLGPGVVQSGRDAQGWSLLVKDGAEWVRWLVQTHPNFTGLEVRAATLEEAFLHLRSSLPSP